MQSLVAADKNTIKLKGEEAAGTSTTIHRMGQHRSNLQRQPTTVVVNLAIAVVIQTTYVLTTCRFHDAECKKCHKKGHLARVCKNGERPWHQQSNIHLH